MLEYVSERERKLYIRCMVTVILTVHPIVRPLVLDSINRIFSGLPISDSATKINNGEVTSVLKLDHLNGPKLGRINPLALALLANYIAYLFWESPAEAGEYIRHHLEQKLTRSTNVNHDCNYYYRGQYSQ